MADATLYESKTLKLTSPLPVTFGVTTKLLPIVRAIFTQKYTVWRGRETGIGSVLDREQVEIVFRAGIADFYDELLGATAADPVPQGRIQFGVHSVDALMGSWESETPSNGPSAELLTCLLLRVPNAAFDVNGDDWEFDEKHSYTNDGLYVTAVKPKELADG